MTTAGVVRLVIEGFLDHSRQADELAIAFAAVRRSVHDGQSRWFEIGQKPENAIGLAGVRHVAGQRPLLQLDSVAFGLRTSPTHSLGRVLTSVTI